jgi:acyl-[acyl carrier protein]--UDP-N-acetylglucosamine O-acyltransferase
MKLFSDNIIFLGGGKFSKQIKSNYLHNYDKSFISYDNQKLKVKEKNISYYISADYNKGFDFITPNSKNDYYIITIAEPNQKEDIENKFLTSHSKIKKINLISINNDIDETSIIRSGGVIINSIICFNSLIKENVFISSWCIISPNVIIGKNCSIFARTTIAANCFVGENTSIGTNCYIHEGITIGKNCTISPGSIIFENISDNTFYFKGTLIKKG